MRLGLGLTDPKGRDQGRGETLGGRDGNGGELSAVRVRGLERQIRGEALASGEGPSPRPWFGAQGEGAVSI